MVCVYITHHQTHSQEEELSHGLRDDNVSPISAVLKGLVQGDNLPFCL